MEKKENQRVRLTKRLLKNALIELLETTPLRNITITEICAKAEINRTTFYKYYASEYELYVEIENEFIETLSKNLSNCNEEGLEKLFSIMIDNAKIASVLFNNSKDEDFPQKIFALPEITENMKFKNLDSSRHKEDIIFFICNGGYAVIKKWINTDFSTSPKDLSDFLILTIKKIIE